MFFEDPKLPKKLFRHSCVTQGNELIVIGGCPAGSDYSSDLIKLKLENGQFEWTAMNVKLNTPRGYLVAALIPAEFN